MSQFHLFADAVRTKFNELAKHDLYVVEVSKDTICNTYLAAFPEGTNPIYKERREYDCQTCHQFLKNIGNVVAIINNELVSVWDVKVPGYYQQVADTLAALTKSAPIRNVFLTSEPSFGVVNNTVVTESGPITWHHFSVSIPKNFRSNDVASIRSNIEGTVAVFRRGLNELTTEALTTALELIDQNSLYRGAEFRAQIAGFLDRKRAYDSLDSATDKDIYVWSQYKAPVARIRNTAIGTLLQDLSEGRELEQAVRAYEAVVAPSNYKRPTALITPGMIKQATETIEALGIEPSLHRRFATLSDISVNNVLFADRSASALMKDSIASLLTPEVKSTKQTFDNVEEISIDDFLSKVLPSVTSIEALVKNNHSSNFMSLIAPVYQGTPNILKWDNNFSWSYNGNITDSMKERVKSMGGKVDGALRFSIQWNDDNDNHNDLDAHCVLPNLEHIYFGDKRHLPTQGNLDVDITQPNGIAVENIIFPYLEKLVNGTYQFYVHNYRGSDGRNFTAEIEYDGVIHSYQFKGRCSGTMKVADVTYSKSSGFSIKHHMESTAASKQLWNVTTEQFVKVNSIMLSPNYWDDQVNGNKHYFFMLDKCTNPEAANGFYNEFLRNELMEHRKVFEVLASKLKCEFSDDQLSGLGFSSTQRNELIVKVKGSFTRLLKIKF